jgi:hypothetical protein
VETAPERLPSGTSWSRFAQARNSERTEMAGYFAQARPLCGAAAEYCWVDAQNRKYFQCPNCASFQISTRAETVLSQHSQKRRDFYASQAPKAPDNHLFVILMPDHEYRQKSSDVLQADFVSKSDLPLNCE